MIDPETALHGVRLLATAIGEMMEDAISEALRLPVSGARKMLKRAVGLGDVGTDIAALATAMQVLIRRTEGTQR